MTTFQTTQLVEKESALLVNVSDVIVVTGKDKGARAVVALDALTIGNGIDCGLRLSDPAVSQLHAELLFSDGVLVVRDLGSKNGIFVDGVQVHQAPVTPGTVIGIGKSRIKVTQREGATRFSLADPQIDRLVVAQSPSMRAFLSKLQVLARGLAPIMLTGETGCGKEVAALWLHEHSARAEERFLVFDCGAAQGERAYTELFGHLAGSFEGAIGDREGLIRSASRGTLLLDQIDLLPAALQREIVKAIDHGLVVPYGAEHGVPLETRLVCTTNRNTAGALAAGDLLPEIVERLGADQLRMPSLRERPEDLPVLIAQFAEEFGVSVSQEMATTMAAYRWPGNVRELKNTIERAAVVPIITSRPKRPEAEGKNDWAKARQAAIDAFEMDFLRSRLEENDFNAAKTAREVGISRAHMTRLIAKHDLRSHRHIDDILGSR